MNKRDGIDKEEVFNKGLEDYVECVREVTARMDRALEDPDFYMREMFKEEEMYEDRKGRRRNNYLEFHKFLEYLGVHSHEVVAEASKLFIPYMKEKLEKVIGKEVEVSDNFVRHPDYTYRVEVEGEKVLFFSVRGRDVSVEVKRDVIDCSDGIQGCNDRIRSSEDRIWRFEKIKENPLNLYRVDTAEGWSRVKGLMISSKVIAQNSVGKTKGIVRDRAEEMIEREEKRIEMEKEQIERLKANEEKSRKKSMLVDDAEKLRDFIVEEYGFEDDTGVVEYVG